MMHNREATRAPNYGMELLSKLGGLPREQSVLSSQLPRPGRLPYARTYAILSGHMQPLNESMRMNRLFTHHSDKIFRKDILGAESDFRMHDLREIWLPGDG